MSDPGWRLFPFEQRLLDWVEAVRPTAIMLSAADEARHGGTWRPGVNLLPNDAQGRVAGGPPLACAALDNLPPHPLDRGQLSAVLPGYPRREPDEPEAAHRFRRDRAAAHLDGLLPEGAARRRHLREHHAWLLGIPLSDHGADAAPFVIWEGSHEIIRSMLRTHLPSDPEYWGDTDLTEPYHAARREIFATCPRREIHAKRGEAYTVHRLALHGTAPFATTAHAPPEGRLIAYFRPETADRLAWLNAP
ncbi:hypothetical protein [Pontivivens ytuae]|uniref:Phytanoyl-CoA dioxygenase (PhyH) n=1 Tax=Pontivivens ytuae TaxID=2789856 RepID=A0A7S9QC66_9RHOB|nr:hypothetical protein [Pontivivens ytuae]QPH53603.1 hypothetical protein I0K15_17760 [Pontivivens ytuae]